MAEARGEPSSFDGASDLPPFPDDGSPFEQKPTHLLDQDEHLSPPAAKRRRTDAGPDEEISIDAQFSTPDIHGPGHRIEEEIANALAEENSHALSAANNANEKMESQSPAQATPAPESTPNASSAANVNPAPNTHADVSSMITDILDHTERQEQTVAMGPQEMPPSGEFSGAKGYAFLNLKANSHLKIQSLPILDNLSTQILSFLSKNSYQDLTAMVSEPESEDGQAYATMRSLFDHTKRVYTIKRSFLQPSDVEVTDSSQLDVLRKANLASFVSSIFGSQEIGFAELNEHFLDVFVPEGGRLLKVQAALYLELKTQAFIAAMNTKSRTRTQLLYELFPEDMEQRLLARRPGTRQLAPSETDFVNRLTSRRDILLNDVHNEDALKALPDKYHWEDFLRDLSSYIAKNFDSINMQQGKKPIKGRQASTSASDVQEASSTTHQSQFPVNQPVEVPVDRNMHGDLVARAARAAQIALQGHGLRRSQQQQQQQQQQAQPQSQATSSPSHSSSMPLPQQHQPQQLPQSHQQQQSQPHQLPQTQAPPPPQPQHQSPHAGQGDNQYLHGYAPVQQSNQPAQQQQYHHSPTPPGGYQQSPGMAFQQSPMQTNFQQYNPNAAQVMQARANGMSPGNHGYMPGIPHYSQSQPTQVLYERARMAASAKSSPTNRKAGLPSQRRPWTTEEENALMAGLDRVKGPHWSQILAMFGPGGTISEALKDRNQVQLKDKARNLKLFFLKSGIEVPYYLKFVTGELKTRAPAQAAKREARERQKKQGEEDKAHVEGIKGMMALAGAHPSPVGGHEMSASPSLPPDANAQSMFDQTAEQNLMQTLSQEVHGSQYPQQHPAPTQDHHIDPHMQLGQ
ncbi:Transcription factor TBF1-like protein [Penicillium ucsense]|uniref:Transcription factor TBF1-like protein n=1 Tax=Penicillium ucsense TaxID=2839758 RepID=A0A8J8WH73_9EURO|nr:Transcription factor TBF1-like protein [Penicillium ucsense]KAF7735600.1 Transcription factor TBF1-like protein [Penicillium ucsense]